MTDAQQREAARQFANKWMNGGDEIVEPYLIPCIFKKPRKHGLSANFWVGWKPFLLLSD